MPKRFIFILIISIIFTACVHQYYMSAVSGMEKTDFQESELYPSYEFFNLRIDVIRQVKKNEETGETQLESYNSVGFYLGNGLFYDLNRNLSFSVLDMLGVNVYGDFEIVEYNEIFKRISTRYIKKNNVFIRDHNNILLNINNKMDVFFSDSLVIVDNGIFFSTKITLEKDVFNYSSGLINNKIIRQNNGWYRKFLLGQSDYLKIDNNLLLDYTYTISNLGETIHIYNSRIRKNSRPLQTIEQTDSEIYVYNRYYSGFKIYKEHNKITVERDGVKEVSYYISTNNE